MAEGTKKKSSDEKNLGTLVKEFQKISKNSEITSKTLINLAKSLDANVLAKIISESVSELSSSSSKTAKVARKKKQLKEEQKIQEDNITLKQELTELEAKENEILDESIEKLEERFSLYSAQLTIEKKSIKTKEKEIETVEKETEAIEKKSKRKKKEQKEEKKEETQDKKDKKEEKKEEKKEQENIKETYEKSSQKLKEFGGTMSSTFSYMKGLAGINLNVWGAVTSQLQSQFGGLFDFLQNMFFKPLTAFGRLLIPGSKKSTTTSAASQEKEKVKEKVENKQTDTFRDNILELVSKIESYLGPKRMMIKGGSLADWLKNLPAVAGAGRFMKRKEKVSQPTLGETAAAGAARGAAAGAAQGAAAGIAMQGIGKGVISKLGIAALFAGGIYMMVQDFMEGFAKEGISGGFQQAVLGNLNDSLFSGIASSMGKWALLGAGIGSVVPVVGTIAGAILGASFGFLVNYLSRLVSSDSSAENKIMDFFFGGTGIIGTLFSGMKYAAMGAMIGSVVPGVGTLFGGIVGFVVGALVNFVWQIIDPGVKALVVQVGKKIFEGFKSVWNAFVVGIGIVWNGIVSLVNGFITNIKNFVVGYFNMMRSFYSMLDDVLSWLAEKLGIKKYYDEMKLWVTNKWTQIKTSVQGIFETIFNFVINIWDSFKTVMKDYWDRIKVFFGAKGKATTIEQVEKGKPIVAPQTQQEKKSTVIQTATNIVSQAIPSNSFPKTSKDKKTEQKVSLMNDMWQKIQNKTTAMSDFVTKNMVPKFEKMLGFNTDNMIQKQAQLAENERRYSYFQQYGTMEGYTQEYSKYHQELQKMQARKEEMKTLKATQAASQQIVNQTTVNNINAGEKFGLKLKDGSPVYG